MSSHTNTHSQKLPTLYTQAHTLQIHTHTQPTAKALFFLSKEDTISRCETSTGHMRRAVTAAVAVHRVTHALEHRPVAARSVHLPEPVSPKQ